MRVLLVEDDRIVVDFVRRALEEEHYTVTVCFDGAAGMRATETSRFDIIVLDIMLPLLDGLTITRRLRRQNVQIPILLLTGRDAPMDVVRGLDAGADDYLTKPFSLDVLLARIRARTRAAGMQPESRQRFGDLTMDFERHLAWRGKTRLPLTRTEFSILECLMRAAGRLVTRDHLINTVWGDRELCHNNLSVFMSGLRAKVNQPDRPQLIYTERGIGYRLMESSFTGTDSA